MQLYIFFATICHTFVTISSGEAQNFTDEKITRGSTDDKLKVFLDTKLRNILREGNEEIGIPILDPLEIVGKNFALDNDDFMLDGTLVKFYAEGLSNYNVTKAKLNIFKRNIVVGVNFEEIVSNGEYNFFCTLLKDIMIRGDGEFNMTVKNFSFTVDVVLSSKNGLSLESLNLTIALGGLELSVGGIVSDQVSFYIGKVISSVAPELVDGYHKEITTYLSENLMVLANEKLQGKTIGDLLILLD